MNEGIPSRRRRASKPLALGACAGLVGALALGTTVLGGPRRAEAGLPEGWRPPSAKEAEDLLVAARRWGGAPNQRLAVTADFDGDGRKDRAQILLNDRTGKFALFVMRASVGRYEKLTNGSEISGLWNYTLSVDPPGVYEPACARGIGDDDEPCEREVRIQWPGVELIVVESSAEMFFWDGQKFRGVFLTD